MNKDYYAYIITGAILLLAVLTMIVPKYFGNVEASEGSVINSEIEKIEVIHFHATSQCYSCKTLGDLSEEALNTYFSSELESGKITFSHINIDLAENSEQVKKYEATGSSLMIGTYFEEGSFVKEQNTNVWYKIGDKANFMNYFKGVIENKLLGK